MGKADQVTYSHCITLHGWIKGKVSDVSLKGGMHLDVSWENDPFDLYLIHKPHSDQLT